MSLSDKYCEGWCKENGGKFTDCTGCEIAELEQELADNQYQIDILVKEGDKEIKRLREALEHIAAADPFSIRIAKQALEGRDE